MVPDRKSRSYWGYVAAIGLATFLAVALVWLEVGKPEFPESPREQDVELYYHPGGRSCDPMAIGPFAAGEPLSNSIACEEAREEYRLKANDLIQQRRAANAAATAAYFSNVQTLLGIVGMGFGFLTFVAAVAAAIYAKMAAVATERTADVAQEIGEAQVRAYLGFEVPSAQVVAGRPLKFTVRIANHGQSPARNVAVAVATTAFIRERDWKWDSEPTDTPSGDVPSATIHANGSIMAHPEMDPPVVLDGPVVTSLMHDKSSAFSSVLVFHEDVFGRKWETRFCFEYSGACFRSKNVRISNQGSYDRERKEM